MGGLGFDKSLSNAALVVKRLGREDRAEGATAKVLRGRCCGSHRRKEPGSSGRCRILTVKPTQPPPASLAADDQQGRPMRGQCLAQTATTATPGGVDDQVMPRSAGVDLLPGVVDYLVGARWSGPGWSSLCCTRRSPAPALVGQLDGERADTAGRADDQHPLARLPHPMTRGAGSAVMPETGTAAACSKLRLAGLRARSRSRERAYSAKEPTVLTP